MKQMRVSKTSVNENDWTFGQMISLALLSSSLFPILQLIYKSRAISEHNQPLKRRSHPSYLFIRSSRNQSKRRRDTDKS